MEQAGGRPGKPYHQPVHTGSHLAHIRVCSGIAYAGRRRFPTLFSVRAILSSGIRQGGHRGRHLEAVGGEGHGVWPHLGQAAGGKSVVEKEERQHSGSQDKRKHGRHQGEAPVDEKAERYADNQEQSQNKAQMPTMAHGHGGAQQA